MNTSYEIKPGIGLGELHFGNSKDIVLEIYGEPNEKEHPEDLNEEGVSTHMEYWHYDDHDLSMAFDLENNEQLISMAISSEKYVLEGNSFIGMPKEELVNKLTQLGYTDLVDNDIVVTSDDLGVNFWLDEGKCTEVQWSPQIISVIAFEEE